jgi:hypothetical protein
MFEVVDIPKTHEHWSSRFNEFKAKHGKTYEPKEHGMRFGNFINNQRYDLL